MPHPGHRIEQGPELAVLIKPLQPVDVVADTSISRPTTSRNPSKTIQKAPKRLKSDLKIQKKTLEKPWRTPISAYRHRAADADAPELGVAGAGPLASAGPAAVHVVPQVVLAVVHGDLTGGRRQAHRVEEPRLSVYHLSRPSDDEGRSVRNMPLESREIGFKSVLFNDFQ